MKLQILKKALYRLAFTGAFLPVVLVGLAQDTDSTVKDETPSETKPAKIKPIKNTFQSVWIIDNQTVMVPAKKTFEMDIQHRFGTINKGYEDFWGFFAPSNIRLGVNYSPLNKLFVGIGITKSDMIWDFSAKYSIIQQTKSIYPVSVTYYGDFSFDTRTDGKNGAFKHFLSNTKITDGDGLFTYYTDRFLYFHQIIIARKINTYRQPNDATIKLPAVGASIGETPRIKISNEITEALLSGGKKSRTIAIAATEATHPLSACKKRITSKAFTDLEVPQIIVATMYKHKPVYNGRFLPNLSSNGPYKI